MVVVAERQAPYEEIEYYALLVSIGAGLVMVAATSALAAWVSRRALAPVGAMTATARDWSEHDLERRFDLGPPTNEIRSLGTTLDLLLDRVAGAIRSEQRLTAELAHELRTPLASVQASADLMALHADLPSEVRDDVEAIRVGSRLMGETIEGLLALARSESSSQAAACSLMEVVADVVPLLPGDEAAVAVDVPDGLRIAVPHALAVRTLSPLVVNAVGFSDTVRVRARSSGPRAVRLEVEDDGPGLDELQVDRVFVPGHSFSGEGGHGLGSLSRAGSPAAWVVTSCSRAPWADAFRGCAAAGLAGRKT